MTVYAFGLLVRRYIRQIFVIGMLAGGVTGISSAAPITFNTALPVSDEEVIVREQFIFAHSSDDVLGFQREVDQFTALTVVGYGVTSRLAVFGILPVTHINREIDGNDTDVTGLGDSMLFARYEIFRRDNRGRTLRVAPFAGVRVPTGEDGRTGDGSTDVFGGLILTSASVKFNLDAQVAYNINREADGVETGDSVSFDGSLQYRLLPMKITAETRGFLFGVLEGNVTHNDETQIAGVRNLNSGGTQISISPGIQYATQRWIADLAVRIPVLNNLNGTALAPDFSVLTSFRVNF